MTLIYNKLMGSVVCGAHVLSNNIVFSAPHTALPTEPSLRAQQSNLMIVCRYLHMKNGLKLFILKFGRILRGDLIRKIFLTTGVLLASLFSLQAQPAGELVIYEPPPYTDAAPEFEVEVNGEKVFVYTSRVAAFASFSFSGKVDVKVTFAAPVYNHDIRPKSKGIASQVKDNQIQFSIDEPAHLSVEINKNIKRPLFIFANPLETDIPDRNDPNVLFFEQGKVHTPGTVNVKDNQTVYIEGGAIVRGTFMTDKGKNITFKGRGIIDNSRYSRREIRPIEINQCEKVLVEGIIINESRHWTLGLFASRDVQVRNLKIVSDNDNDDGIDVVGSQNVLIDKCFIRTKDDCIAIKAGINYYTDFFSGGNVDEVTVQNSVLWNGVWGNGLEIGFETRADTMENIVFRNIDIIHVERGGTFTIHNGDRAIVKDVLYENIRVEDSRDRLIDFQILESRYTKDAQRGYIENVHFKNITVGGEVFPTSRIEGFSEKHIIKNVTLQNVVVQDRKIDSLTDGKISVKHAENIQFE